MTKADKITEAVFLLINVAALVALCVLIYWVGLSLLDWLKPPAYVRHSIGWAALAYAAWRATRPPRPACNCRDRS